MRSATRDEQIDSFDLAQAEDWFGSEPTSHETPERRRALAVLDAAMTLLREQCAAAGKAALFDQLSPFLSREPEPGEYAALATALAMRENSIAVGVHRLRQQYRDAVRHEVAAGMNDPALVDEELRHLAESL